MNDPGVIAAERGLKAVERRLRRIYGNARANINATIRDFNIRFMRLDNEMRRKVDEGIITEAEYKRWLKYTVFRGEQWDAKVSHCTDILADSNRQALNVIRGHQLNVFAENASYQAYQLEKGTGMNFGFGVYDSHTVEKLLKDQPELLPRKKLITGKDKAWNKNKISNSITQSIIQGDGIPQVAETLAKNLAMQNDDAMVRYARTAMTCAQNAGRMETMHEAQDMGIKVRKKWLATLDSRTRDAHADLDGQTADVDEPFTVMFQSGKAPPVLVDIMFPGDPNCDEPGMVYNCRCTMTYEIDGYGGSGQRRDQESGELIDGDITYSEWKKMKGK